jgi:hypothetical protein
MGRPQFTSHNNASCVAHSSNIGCRAYCRSAVQESQHSHPRTNLQRSQQLAIQCNVVLMVQQNVRHLLLIQHTTNGISLMGPQHTASHSTDNSLTPLLAPVSRTVLKHHCHFKTFQATQPPSIANLF